VVVLGKKLKKVKWLGGYSIYIKFFIVLNPPNFLTLTTFLTYNNKNDIEKSGGNNNIEKKGI
jgi:hypothetical protein